MDIDRREKLVGTLSGCHDPFTVLYDWVDSNCVFPEELEEISRELIKAIDIEKGRST